MIQKFASEGPKGKYLPGSERSNTRPLVIENIMMVNSWSSSETDMLPAFFYQKDTENIT